MKVYAWYRFESLYRDSRSLKDHTQDIILWSDFDDHYHYQRSVSRGQKTRHGVLRQHQKGIQYYDNMWLKFEMYFITRTNLHITIKNM